ncbi:MAG: 16S rRNA (guanine(527)-N(7))-methyltransferase RsmG, partial [Nitrospiria bacterium]
MTDPSLALLARGAADFGLALNSAQLDHFDRYLTEMEKWNRRMNLTGAHSRHEIVARHLLDSLAGALVLREIGTATVADLGSGAGFPGLPLKIAFPSWDMTLIEPRQKRAAFLLHMCGTLGLSNLQVLEHTVNPRQT